LVDDAPPDVLDFLGSSQVGVQRFTRCGRPLKMVRADEVGLQIQEFPCGVNMTASEALVIATNEMTVHGHTWQGMCYVVSVEQQSLAVILNQHAFGVLSLAGEIEELQSEPFP